MARRKKEEVAEVLEPDQAAVKDPREVEVGQAVMILLASHAMKGVDQDQFHVRATVAAVLDGGKIAADIDHTTETERQGVSTRQKAVPFHLDVPADYVGAVWY